MLTYYEILGVSEQADINEIKAAFRKLAKQYHPDRNPNGKEFFERALLAYETLSDANRKYAYDLRLKQHSSPIQPENKARSGQKTWKFDERELKRRQYYNEHIRKYAKETASYNAQNEGKTAYNEYKYILFATPLAVALFVMIMKLTGPTTPGKQTGPVPQHATFRSVSGLKPGDAPYNFIFGNPYYEINGGKKLIIKNMTGFDAVVCIFSGRQFVRSFFVQSGFSAEVPQLPRRPLDIRYCAGLHFDNLITLEKSRVVGGFRKEASYFRSVAPLIPGDNVELSLTPGISEGFVQTTEKDFFTLPHDQEG